VFGREPAAILGALNAVVALGVGFGLDVTPEQLGLISAALAAVLALVVRSQVTPVEREQIHGRHEARKDDPPSMGERP
jgi:hypothetical protein